MQRIVEIKALENGAHRNQTGEFIEIPEGWAIVPEDMETPNFPFGEIESIDEEITLVEKVDGEEAEKVITRKVVAKWTAGVVPEFEEEIPAPTETEKLRADIDYIAIMTGVEL